MKLKKIKRTELKAGMEYSPDEGATWFRLAYIAPASLIFLGIDYTGNYLTENGVYLFSNQINSTWYEKPF